MSAFDGSVDLTKLWGGRGGIGGPNDGLTLTAAQIAASKKKIEEEKNRKMTKKMLKEKRREQMKNSSSSSTIKLLSSSKKSSSEKSKKNYNESDEEDPFSRLDSDVKSGGNEMVLQDEYKNPNERMNESKQSYSHSSSSSHEETSYDEESENFFLMMTGTIKGTNEQAYWNPLYWRLELLPNTTFTVTLKGTMMEFEKEKNTFSIKEDIFFENFKSKAADCKFLNDLCIRAHEKNQTNKSVTPFVINVSYTSDLPFPVYLVSYCGQHENSQQNKRQDLVTDVCNQKKMIDSESIFSFSNGSSSSSSYDESKRSKVDRYMKEIIPSTQLMRSEKNDVDFRKIFSNNATKSTFRINYGIVEREFIQFNVGTDLWFLKKNGELMKIIEAFAISKTNSTIRDVANMIMNEIRSGTINIKTFQENEWYEGVNYRNIRIMLDHIKLITKEIPNYQYLTYKLVLPEKVEWTKPVTWPLAYVHQFKYENLFSPTDNNEMMLKKYNFTVNLTFDFYYL